jgi:ATP-dependent Clp protease protease subunit
MEIHLREVMATTRRMAEIIAFHSGKALARVEADIDRDYFMTAEEARAYGIIDEVIVPGRGVAAAGVELPVAAGDDARTRQGASTTSTTAA